LFILYIGEKAKKYLEILGVKIDGYKKRSLKRKSKRSKKRSLKRKSKKGSLKRKSKKRSLNF
jgi:hypothetical protein